MERPVGLTERSRLVLVAQAAFDTTGHRDYYRWTLERATGRMYLL